MLDFLLFRQVTIKKKLIVSFAVILLIYVGASVFQWKDINQVEQSIKHQGVEYEKRIQLAEINRLLQEMNTLEMNLAATSDTDLGRLLLEKGTPLLNTLEALSFRGGSEAEQWLKELGGQARQYMDTVQQMIGAMEAEDTDPLEKLESIDRYNVEAQALSGTLLGLHTQLYEHAALEAEAAQKRSYELLDRTSAASLIAILLVLLFTSLVAVMLILSFTLPVNRLRSALKRMSEGDLRHLIQSKDQDELGELSRHFDHMVLQVREMLLHTKTIASSLSEHSTSFKESCTVTSAANRDIVRAIHEISQGADQQAAQSECSAELIQELEEQIHEITASTTIIVEMSSQAGTSTQAGVTAVTGLKETSEHSHKLLTAMFRAMEELAGRFAAISKITEAISEVSSQTNLLSLNAAIEASRAGTEGKGFAVIAEEVRLLSTQTKESSSHIAKIVEALKEDMSSFQRQMLEAKSSMESQYGQAAKTLSAFQEIERNIGDITGQIEMIYKKVDVAKQKNGAITSTIQQVAAIAEETAAGVQEVNASSIQQDGAIHSITGQAGEVYELSNRLFAEISNFRLENEEPTS